MAHVGEKLALGLGRLDGGSSRFFKLSVSYFEIDADPVEILSQLRLVTKRTE